MAGAPTITIEPGYRPGFLARCLEMHIAFYHPSVHWGLAFETSLAKDFAEIIERLEKNPRNQVWAAVETPPPQTSPGVFTQRIVGTLLVDSESLKTTGAAQIRGFIVDERVRGLGIGKKLLAAAMEFIESNGFDKATLYTSGTQDTAVYLYKKAGFVVELDEEKIVWEKPLRVLQLTWKRPQVADREPNGVSEGKNS
ncbi:N-acetyltransferase domain-containing protein [Fusarium keratoplasticum]|nr:N-acetyltransferase domain-containing protein [Fusarium keratoplasticum]